METWKGIDQGIQRLAMAVLLRLKLLAEGPAAGIVAFTSHGKPDSQEPLPYGSLYEYFLPRFARCTTNGQLRKEILRAAAMLLRLRGRHEDVVVEIELPPDEEAAAKLVVSRYAGKPAADVAKRLTGRKPGFSARIMQTTDIRWVKKVRSAARCDPETGYPKDGWRGWSEGQRTEEIRRLRERGWSQRKIAEHFGLKHHSSIQSYWAHATPRRTA